MSPSAALRARLAGGGFAPLLPAQTAVAERLAERGLDALRARRSNGTAIQPLHHRRWPRSAAHFRGQPS